MLLMTELNEEVQIITEAKEDGTKKFYIEGTILAGNVKNRNGRWYPTELLVKESDRYTNEYITRNKAYGELNHPEKRASIDLERACVRFVELRQNGNDIVGKARVLESTPMGQIVKGLINDGCNLGISSRGLGSVKKNSYGLMEVQSDFVLMTPGDIVADPSGPNCYVNGIMEGVEYFYDVASGSWEAMKTVEEHVQEIHSNYKKIDEKRAFEMFETFLNTLKNK